MTDIKEVISWCDTDTKKSTREIDLLTARFSLGNSCTVNIVVKGLTTGTLKSFTATGAKVGSNPTADYNASTGFCNITDEALYAIDTVLPDTITEDVTLVSAETVNPYGQVLGKVIYQRNHILYKGKRFTMNVATRLHYQFDQDSRELIVQDQLSNALIPLQVSVINFKGGSRCYLKNDLTKPIVVKHLEMDQVIADNYTMVNGDLSHYYASKGSIDIYGGLNRDCSIVTVGIDVDKALLFRISNPTGVTNFKSGTNVDFWLGIKTTEVK